MGWALGLDEGQVWGGCAELVTLGGAAQMACRSGLRLE